MSDDTTTQPSDEAGHDAPLSETDQDASPPDLVVLPDDEPAADASPTGEVQTQGGEERDDLDDLLGMAGAENAEDEGAEQQDTQVEGAEEQDTQVEGAEQQDTPDTPDQDEEPAEPVRPRRPRSIADVRDKKDLMRLAGQWFVVHTYSGYEQRVKDNLTSRVESLGAEDRVHEVVIPTNEVTEFKKGKKQTVQKKFLPGYVLVRMDMDDELWGLVRHTPAVTGFVGGPGNKPVPLSLREVAETLKIPDEVIEEAEETEEQTAASEKKAAAAEIDLEVGETIRVTTGPFADFTGTIAEINVDQAKLRVMVSVFGRETPLELPFDQVAKL